MPTVLHDLHSYSPQYGPVKEVRMATEQNGQSKGFAFVEFEEEVRAPFTFTSRIYFEHVSVCVQKDAQAALGANNYELKKRRIAVTLADSRVRARNR